VLSFILAPMIEKSLYRLLVMFRGDFSILHTRRISETFLAISLAILIFFSTQKKTRAVRDGD
jgi:TctA family transporter